MEHEGTYHGSCENLENTMKNLHVKNGIFNTIWLLGQK